jgi:hypothetical protein
MTYTYIIAYPVYFEASLKPVAQKPEKKSGPTCYGVIFPKRLAATAQPIG